MPDQKQGDKPDQKREPGGEIDTETLEDVEAGLVPSVPAVSGGVGLPPTDGGGCISQS